MVHKSVYIPAISIVEIDCDIGEGTKIWHWVHIMPGAKIGKECMIGDHVFIGNNVKIGDGVRIQNNAYIPEGVVIEDYVFIGPGVIFTNTKYPTAEFPTRPKDYQETYVCEHTTIGADAIILPGIRLGIDCNIGAGAVVTKDVNIAVTVVGNPAREIER